MMLTSRYRSSSRQTIQISYRNANLTSRVSGKSRFRQLYVALARCEHPARILVGKREPFTDRYRDVAPTGRVEQFSSDEATFLDRPVYSRHAQEVHSRLTSREQQGEGVVHVVANVSVK